MDLKIKDVAELLNVSQTTIRRWLVDGKIPAYRLNHQYRFSRVEIEDWVLRQKLGQSSNQKQIKLSDSEEEGFQNHAGMRQYSLYRALHKGAVLTKVPGNTKEDIIRGTMKSIATDLNLDADYISDLLLERENLQPTSLGNGIGIPHTRDYLLNNHHDIVVAAYPEKPISYGALDGKPVHIFFFLFACEDKRHLHLLAKIAHLSSLAETHELLASKPSKENLLEYIRLWEAGIQKVEEEPEPD
jgi:nitrogen PTS system EIIA component